MIKIEKWYSVTELAEKTGIPEPSLRRYLIKFKPYFISKGGSRAKRYDSTAIDILKRIKQLYDSGHETNGVANVIKHEFPMIMNDKEKAEMEKNPVTPTLATAEDVAEIKEALKQQQEFNKLLLQKLADQERFIKETIENRDQLLLSKLAEQEEGKESAPTEEKKAGLFQRFFNKK